MNTLSVLRFLFDSPVSAILVRSFSFVVQLVVLVLLFYRSADSKFKTKGIFLAKLMLISGMICDFLWMFDVFGIMGFNTYHYSMGRISLGILVSRYLLMSLFIDQFMGKKRKYWEYFDKFKLYFGSIFSIFFFVTSLLGSLIYIGYKTETAVRIFVIVSVFAIMYQMLFEVSKSGIPKLMKKQLKALVAIFIVYYFLHDFFVGVLRIIFCEDIFVLSLPFPYLRANLATAFYTAALIFAVRGLLKIRFLNIRDTVETDRKSKLLDNFVPIMRSLREFRDLGRAEPEILTVFADSFGISTKNVHFFLLGQEQDSFEKDRKGFAVEKFVGGSFCLLAKYLRKTRALIRDDLEFSAIQKNKAEYKKSLELLDALDADLFLPIYNKSYEIVACVMVDRAVRKELFNKAELQEMVFISNYLGTLVELTKYRKLESVEEEKHELEQKIFEQHKMLQCYENGLYSYVHNAEGRKIGIIYVRSDKKFVCTNQEAEELLGYDPNKEKGHVITKVLKKLVESVEKYRNIRTVVEKIGDKKLAITAIPIVNKGAVNLIIYHPDAADIIKSKLCFLDDASDWNMLMHLETTETGRLINKLIPGNGRLLSNFKISLLKAALSRKPVLLKLPDEDLKSTVDLLHGISLREKIYKIKLTREEKDLSVALDLFGVNLLFLSDETKPKKPMIEELDGEGTIFIENINYLNLETQKYLTEFLKTGFYRRLRSSQRKKSDVQIIASTNANLRELVDNELFSKELMELLQTVEVRMPKVKEFSDEEFKELLEGLARQALKDKSIDHLLFLTKGDKFKLSSKRAESVQKLRKHIYDLMLEKAKKDGTSGILEAPVAFYGEDQLLGYAAKLGSEALKSREMMTFLWNKFQSQSKIATYLGVNKSTIHRRCQQYQLVKKEDQKEEAKSA